MRKRKRASVVSDPESADQVFRCHKKGCNYTSLSERALSIHLSTKRHAESSSSSDIVSSEEEESSDVAVSRSASGSVSSEHSQPSSGGEAHGEPYLNEDNLQHGSDGAGTDGADDAPGHGSGSEDNTGSGQSLNVQISSANSEIATESSAAGDTVVDSVDPDSPDTAASALSAQEQALLQILVKLTQREQQQLLRIITDPSFDPQAIRWTSFRVLRNYLKSINKQEWAQDAVLRLASDKTCHVHYRTDFHRLLQEMLLHPDVHPSHFRPRAGHRIRELRDGKWMRRVWAYVQDNHPEADGVLPYILYSDETHVNPAGRKVHPIVVFLGLPPHIMRRSGLFRYLAYLPSFTAADAGLNLKTDKNRLKEMRRDAFLASVDAALETLKAESYRCRMYKVGAAGVPMRLVAIPCLFVADGLEGNNLLLIMLNSKHPDIHTLIPKSKLDDPDARYRKRTERGTRLVIRAINAHMERGKHGKRAAKALFNRYSLQRAEESPLAGFAATDCHNLIQPDLLHQGDKGDVENMLDLIKQGAGEDNLAIIDERLASIPPVHGLPLPSRGLSTPKMYGSQQAALLKCLPVALLGLEGDLFAALRIVIPAYLDFQRLRDQESHDEDSLERLAAACRRFMTLAVELLGAYRSFTYSKFHANTKYVGLIREFGSAALASASAGEATHARIKAGYHFSNKKIAGLEQQIRDHIINADLVRPVAASAAAADDKPARSAGQLAVRTGKHQLIASTKRLDYRELTAAGPAAEWLQRQPELQSLQRCLRLFLAGMPGAGEGAEMHMLPHTKGNLIFVRPGLAVPIHIHRGSLLQGVTLRAVPEFGGGKREAFDFVAVRSEEEEEGVWFAQLRLVFSCMDEEGEERSCAFVRWLCKAQGAELPMQRLMWATTVDQNGAVIPWYDVIHVATIERPVLLQADPTCEGFFYYNKYAGR